MLQLFVRQEYGATLLSDQWRMYTETENIDQIGKRWKQVQNVDVVEQYTEF